MGEAVDLLKSYDELTVAGGGRQNLQKVRFIILRGFKFTWE